MKYKIMILFILFCISYNLHAQTYYYGAGDEKDLVFEAGISFGPMNCLTDLGGRVGNGKRGVKDLNIKSTTVYGSIYAAALYKNWMGARLEGTIGSVKSNDSLLASVKTSAYGRYNRNLSFRSPIDEISLTLEFHPVDLLKGYAPTISPYAIAGIGYFHFNPQALLNGTWIDLRPLHTEGEGFAEYPASKEYKLNQVNVPLGFGMKFEAGRFNLRLEYITRVLFTDYLDDVHNKYIDPAVFSRYLSGAQLTDALILNNRVRSDATPNETTARPFGKRGNPSNNDAYFTVNLKIGYVFSRERGGAGGNGGGGGYGNTYKSDRAFRRAQKRQLSCPRIY